MEAPALPPQELTLDRVAHEGVAEAELVVVLLQQQAALHQAPQVGDQLVFRAAGHGGQHVERCMAAEHRGGLHDAAIVARQAVEVALHELGQRPRERLGAELRGVVVARGDKDLLEEEGVAAGAVEQRVADRAGDRPVVHRAKERGHLGPAEPVEAQLVDLVAPLEADKDLRRRHPSGELVGPVGAHDQQRRPGQRREALEDRQALGVGPVEVLEHDQPGCLAEPHVDGRKHATDGIVALESVVGQHRPDQLVGPPERPVLGLPAEHHRPGRGRRDQLAQQPRLADARLAGDERDGRAAVVASPVLVDVRLAGGGQEAGQAGEGRRPPHHRRAEAGTTHEHRGRAYRRDPRPGPGLLGHVPAGRSTSGGTGAPRGRVASTEWTRRPRRAARLMRRSSASASSAAWR